MVHIPYKGAAAALTDLMGGQIQLFFDAASGLINPGKTGKVRLIGVASENAPAGAARRAHLHRAGRQGLHRQHLGRPAGAGGHAARDRQARRRRGRRDRPARRRQVEARGDGHDPRGSTPAEFEAFIASETAKWGKVIRDAKITAE